MDRDAFGSGKGSVSPWRLYLIVVAGDSVHVVLAQSPKQRFSEIDVERINVVEADGTVKLVIANRQRAPDQVMGGSPGHVPRTTSPRALRSSTTQVTRRGD